MNFANDQSGDRFSLIDGNTDSIYLASNFGSFGWQHVPIDDSVNYFIVSASWANVNYGITFNQTYIGGNEYESFLAITSDAGSHWSKIANNSTLNEVLQSPGALDYPFPGVIIIHGGETGSPPAISLDTGKTWKVGGTLPASIDYVLPNRWVALISNSTFYGPELSTDSGQTWKAANYYHPQGTCSYYEMGSGCQFSFKDSLNGLECNGWDVIAGTSDGGNIWQTLDSSDYMFGSVTPAMGLDNAYYSFYPFHDTTRGNQDGAYAYFTGDRGVTWKTVLSNAGGYAFAGLDSQFWVGGTGFAQISSLSGSGTKFSMSWRDSTRITAIDKNFVWVSDAIELHSANTQGGLSWGRNEALYIPGYDTSFSYRFFPIDRNVVYVRAPDTIYVTNDEGSSWTVAPAMPDKALDFAHWFVFTSDTTSLLYTSNAGASFTTVTIPNANAHTILPIDSVRWYVTGFYTINSGVSWQHIPGWDNRLGLYAVDSTTAFGEPFAGSPGTVQILWRLDLSLASSVPAGVAEREPYSSTLSIFPNPAANSITVASANGTILILDPLGRNYSVPKNGNMLDISSLPSGVHFVSDGVSRAKFVKE